MARGLPRPRVLASLRAPADHPDVVTTWVDAAPQAEATQLLASLTDETYSPCDAVSSLLMRRHWTTEALTTDHHFEQAGLVRPPAPWIAQDRPSRHSRFGDPDALDNPRQSPR
jgi:hypothetical protein